MEQMPKKKPNLITTILTVVIIGALVIALLVHFTSDVNKVKNGHPQLYPNTTWGDALDKVCKNGKWKAFRRSGSRYVTYNGKIKSSGEKLEITFKMKDRKSFTVEKIRKGDELYTDDGEGLGAIDMYLIITDIFENKL